MVRSPYRLSRPLLAGFAVIIACSALLGVVPALNEGSLGGSRYGAGAGSRARNSAARRATFAAAQNSSSVSPGELAVIRAALEGAGFTPAGNIVRHENDNEIPVRDARGAAWVALLDKSGTALEVEIVDYDEDEVPETPAFDAASLPAMIAKEGFQARGEAELKSDHFEIKAVNRRSEPVELHVDFAGQIYKQVWLR